LPRDKYDAIYLRKLELKNFSNQTVGYKTWKWEETH